MYEQKSTVKMIKITAPRGNVSKTSLGIYIHCVSKKGYHPTTNDNFNSSCPIPVIFGVNIAE